MPKNTETEKAVRVGNIAADELLQHIQAIERLEEEKAGIGRDITERFASAKGSGFDVPAMKEVIKLRKLERSELDEKEHMRDLYMRVAGLLPDLDENEVAA